MGEGGATRVGTTIVGTASTAVAVDFTTTNFAAGELYRLGAKSDGRGDGQFIAISSKTGSTATGLVAAPAAPTTAGDVVYAALNIWPTETPATSMRFLVGHTETGAQWHLTGCKMSGLKFSFPLGEPALPTCTQIWQAAYWGRSAVTIPSAVALENCNVAPSASGSLFYNTVSTATRATIDAGQIDLEIDMGLAPVVSVGGGAPYTNITGWTRTRAIPTLTLKTPWVTTYDALYDTDGSGTTVKHILATLNTTDGRAVGLYFPRLYAVGAKPTIEEFNEQGYQTLMLRGTESTTLTTNDLTKSAFRLALA